MAVTLIDEIRAAEKTAEEIREAAVDEAREIAKRAQAALESDEELAHFTLHRFVADNEGAKVV